MSAASDRYRDQVHDELYIKLVELHSACHKMCRVDMRKNMMWIGMFQQVDQYLINMRPHFERDDE